MIATVGALLADLEIQFVPGHYNQVAAQLAGFIQIVLPAGGAKEKAAENGLANIHRIEKAPKAGIAQAHPNLHPDGRLVFASRVPRPRGHSPPECV